jgi:tryptophan synthase alpha chain
VDAAIKTWKRLLDILDSWVVRVSRPRLNELIASKRDAGSGVVIGYLPLGFPDVPTSIEAARALIDAGIDALELGIPYSDPVMDGQVIAQATQTALANGFKLKDVFPAIRAIAEGNETPLAVMTYWNPVLQYGVEKFTADLLAAGATGLITPDLIPDEASEWLDVSERLGAERVFLAAPSSSPKRLENTAQHSSGFVYAVSTMGITGTREDVDNAAHALVERLRGAGAKDVCVGVGISTADHVRNVLEYADGAIVGTALVRALGDGGVPALRELAASLVSIR